MTVGQDDRQLHPRRVIRAPQNFVGGCLLIALAVFAVWATSHLGQGTLRSLGPAMFPRWVAIAIGVCGLILFVSSFVKDGPPLETWNVRAAVLVTASIVAFALTIRDFGFVMAAGLMALIGGFASQEVRKKELVIAAAVMTIFCLVLFRYLLDQPIPVLIIPGTSIRIE
jgi:hypothetical protein